MNRARKARRRAQKLAVPTESFKHTEIFDRDRWRCQLCGITVLKAARFPHPRSATLDHVVPLAKGGAHTRANVQLACARCNSLKGDRVLKPEQLRLIG